MAQNTPMLIEIHADLICPWCALGVRRLRRALAERPGLAPLILWQPYRIAPDLPPGGVPRAAWLEQRFGSLTQAAAVFQGVAEAGESEGLDFRLDLIARTPESMDAHRLIRHMAARSGGTAPLDLIEDIFAAYLREGLDIGDAEILAGIAARHGLDADQCRSFLAGPEERQAVAASNLSARRSGVQAVPCITFDKRYALVGAQEAESFAPLFTLCQLDAAGV
jgi:predicted DsbA family dithiol-disulfide isomerase